MSTNYNILLKSEKKLKKLVVEYVSYVKEIHFKLWNEVKNVKDDDYYSIYDNVERRIKKSIIMEEELLDECIWTISKDDPRANHLKFIINIIYSTKDITRACEYAFSIAKIIVRKNFDKNKLKLLQPIIDLYLKTIQSILELYSSAMQDKLEKIDEIYSKFETNLEIESKKIRDELRKTNNEVTYIQISQITRLIDSTIERLKGIFPSTIFVKTNTNTITTNIKVSKTK